MVYNRYFELISDFCRMVRGVLMLDDDSIMMFCCLVGVITAALSLASFIDNNIAQGTTLLFVSFIAYIAGGALEGE